MPERLGHLNDAQREAVTTLGRSLLVSAAAGSGKTTVLAERCAALVCDPPTAKRCRIDELLVVTFTDAAAGEMKSRIGAAIRKRLQDSPRDEHLRQQLYLLDSANISTIHSFCRTLIQRWFPQAQVDPQAAVLSGDEAALLREEVLDALFVELYGSESPLSGAFQTLVDDYGAGNDYAVGRVVLQLHDFVNSLPDPEGWLEAAVQRVDPAARGGLLAEIDDIQRARLSEELALQIEYCRHAAATIRRCWPIAAMHADAIDEHVANLEHWHKDLSRGKSDICEQVRGEIAGFAFDRAEARPRGLSDADKAIFDAAKAVRDRTKELFKSRLQEGVCAFTHDEYRDGLARIAPYIRTLAQLVGEFEKRYQAAKAEQAAVDFNDLQRCAYRLLTDGSPDRPSEIARQLQQQYRHVLVDEFQDVDPLQEAILRLVSRESADPPEGNLFTVGDIKQSIYRFRLAEPGLFSRRSDQFDNDKSPFGKLIHLQQNFRSRGSIIDAINTLFRTLMSRSFGGSDYDDRAALHAAARYPETGPGPMFDKPAVELHLLEPVTQQTARDEDDEETSASNGEELEGIEREAYLIGRRIQQWMGDNPQRHRWHVAGKAKNPGDVPDARPIEYRDIVILLRSLPHKAGPIADVLRRMDIPVRLERDQAGMDCTEFRDVVNLLHLLDNRQQDLPMAAVLRSPILGRRFSETELLEIRLFDKSVPFYDAVSKYTSRGLEGDLRDRLMLVLTTLDRYRTRIQRAPVADVLWEIYEEHDYLAYVSGLPDGMRRRDHLLQLHEMARQFGRFARQGLRRFLRFVEDMVERDRPSQQPTAGADENVVRIMTIHAAKGLEFPVVFLADLQKAFNLTDVRGTVLLDRKFGIAMRAADPERRIMYPTLIHQLAADHARREDLSEELRVLYVALTRAREHLVLVGRVSPDRIAAYQSGAEPANQRAKGSPPQLPRLQLETASNMLDWILPAIGAAPAGTVQWPGEKRAADDPALFKVYAYTRADTDKWHIPPAIDVARAEDLVRIAELQPLPADEPLAAESQIDGIIADLTRDYPALELTTMPARLAVSELKRRWDTTHDPQEQPSWKARPRPVARPAFVSAEVDIDAVGRGTVTHRFLQHIDLNRPCDAADLERQLSELTEAGRLSAADAGVVLLDACAWFFDTPLGKRLRARAGDVRREVAFVSRIDPADYDPLVKARDNRDVLLVRGMIDTLLCGNEGLEIVDYKTDAVEAAAAAARAESYRPQIDNYASAIQGIYRRPVSKRWLVFLHARCIIDLAPAGD